MARDIEINIGAKDNATRAINRVNASLGKLTGTVKALSAAPVIASLQQIANGLLRVGRAALTMVNEIAVAGDAIFNLSQRTKLSVETLSQLSFVAQQTGTNIDQLGQAVFRAFRRIGNAQTETGPAARAVKELRLNMEELKEQSPEEMFLSLVDALNAVDDVNRRSQMGFEIFGDNWRQLVPLIEQGTDEIERLMRRGKELGSVTEDQARISNEWVNATSELTFAFHGLRMELATGYMPAIVNATEATTEFFVNAREQGSKSQIALSATMRTITDTMLGPFVGESLRQLTGAAKEAGEEVGDSYAAAVIASMTDQDTINRAKKHAKLMAEAAAEEWKGALDLQVVQPGGIMMPRFQREETEFEKQMRALLQFEEPPIPEELGGVLIPMFKGLTNAVTPTLQATQGRLLTRGPGANQAIDQMNRKVGRIVEVMRDGVPVRVVEQDVQEGDVFVLEKVE